MQAGGRSNPAQKAVRASLRRTAGCPDRQPCEAVERPLGPRPFPRREKWWGRGGSERPHLGRGGTASLCPAPPYPIAQGGRRERFGSPNRRDHQAKRGLSRAQYTGHGMSRLVAVVFVMLGALVPATDPAGSLPLHSRLDAASVPVVAAAGDIVCQSNTPSPTECRHRQTSDLLVGR